MGSVMNGWVFVYCKFLQQIKETNRKKRKERKKRDGKDGGEQVNNPK